MNRSNTQENSPPAIGAPDREQADAVKARLYQAHKRQGTLGTFYDLYLDARPRASEPQRARRPTRGLER